MKKRKLSWRIFRNFMLALLLALWLWIRLGCPIPNPRLDFRRAEWKNLIGPCEIQGVFQVYGKNWVAAVSGDQAVLWSGSYNEMNYWPRNTEGAVLFPVIKYGSFFEEVEIVALDVPEGTASAYLELTVGCWHKDEDLSHSQTITAWRDDLDDPLWWERTYNVEGELLRDGGVLFRVVCPDEHTNPRVNIATVERMTLECVVQWDTYSKSAKLRGIDCHMEAVFYNKVGQELGRAALSTQKRGGEERA